MDQKSNKKPRRRIGKKTWITIIVLFLILVLILAGTYRYYTVTTASILAKQEEAAELQPDSAFVMRGDLANTLEDISGIVRSNQSVYLYWQTSGTVSSVNFQIGDTVQKGDVLAELDLRTIDISIIDAEVTREQAEESMDRLFTSTLPLEQARTQTIEGRQSVADAETVLNSLGVVREDEIEIGVKYDDYIRAVAAYETAATNFETVKDLDLDNPDRIRAQRALESAKTQMDTAKAQYNWYNGETEEIDVQKAQAALLLAQAELDDATRAYDRIKDGPTDSQIRSIQAQIDAATATINTAKIIAPISGTIAQVDTRAFDVITSDSLTGSQRTPAFRIDDLSSHYIDISVTELEINNITLGQKVTITFDAIPFREYSGTIVNISNAGEISNLSVNFPLTVRMDEADDSIKSGMMADVKIVTEYADDVLYVPQQAITVADDGVTPAVRKRMPDGSWHVVIVQLGMSSGSNVQVISDELKEGDEVQLTKVSTGGNFSLNSLININIGGRTPNRPGGSGAPGGMSGSGRSGGSGGGSRRPR